MTTTPVNNRLIDFQHMIEHELKGEEPDEDIIDQEMLDEIESFSRDEVSLKG